MDLPGKNLAGLIGDQPHGLDSLAHDLEGDLLEIEDDIGGILDHAGNRAELVLGPADPNGGDGRTLDRTEEHAAQAIADGGAKAALKRLRGEHAIPFRQRIGIGDQAFGFLKALEHILIGFLH